jgi:hypothetical protein
MREIEQQNADLTSKLQEVSSDLESEVSRNRALQAELAFAKELNAQPNKVSQQLQAVLQQEKTRRVAAEDTAAKLTRTLVRGPALHARTHVLQHPRDRRTACRKDHLSRAIYAAGPTLL